MTRLIYLRRICYSLGCLDDIVEHSYSGMLNLLQDLNLSFDIAQLILCQIRFPVDFDSYFAIVLPVDS